MTPLPVYFVLGKFTFAQVIRTGKVAIFEKWQAGKRHRSFEVVIIQHRPAAIIFGRPIEAHEALPSSEQWGSAGWTCSTQEEALTKFKELCSKVNRRNASSCSQRTAKQGVLALPQDGGGL